MLFVVPKGVHQQQSIVIINIFVCKRSAAIPSFKKGNVEEIFHPLIGLLSKRDCV